MNMPLLDSMLVLIIGILLLGLAARLRFWRLPASFFRRKSASSHRPAAPPQFQSQSKTEVISNVKSWVGLATFIVGLVTALSGTVNSCSNLNMNDTHTETSYIETVDKPTPYPISMPVEDQTYGTKCCTRRGACPLSFTTLAIGSPCMCVSLFGGQAEGTVCE